jgi:hypothetical protein
MGSAPLPPSDIKTHRTEPKAAARDVSRALDHYIDVTKREDAREMKANADVAEDRARLTVKISDIREDVARAKADGDKRIFDATRALASFGADWAAAGPDAREQDDARSGGGGWSGDERQADAPVHSRTTSPAIAPATSKFRARAMAIAAPDRIRGSLGASASASSRSST